MRAATWNVNSLRAHQDGVGAWIEREQPDVLALQEIRDGDARPARRFLAELGYEAAVVVGSGHGGVALAASGGLSDVALGAPGAVAPFDEPRIAMATVDGVRVHAWYAPNGRRVDTREHAVKLAWFRLVTALVALDVAGGAEVLVLADLNIAPTDADVWDASRYRRRNLTSPPERAAYRSLLDAGLVDVVAGASRDGRAPSPAFTWWNRRGDFFESDRGWRLDHVLATPELAAGVTAVAIDRDARRTSGSDHAPVLVEFTRTG